MDGWMKLFEPEVEPVLKDLSPLLIPCTSKTGWSPYASTVVLLDKHLRNLGSA